MVNYQSTKSPVDSPFCSTKIFHAEVKQTVFRMAQDMHLAGAPLWTNSKLGQKKSNMHLGSWWGLIGVSHSDYDDDDRRDPHVDQNSPRMNMTV